MRAVRCVSVCLCSAVGSDDHHIMVVDVENIENCWVLVGSKGAVRSVALWGSAPADDDSASQSCLVASGCADGNVRVWSLSTAMMSMEIQPQATLECLPVDKSAPSATSCKLPVTWQPAAGSVTPRLAVIVDNVVELLVPQPGPGGGDKVSWKRDKELRRGHVSAISAVAWDGTSGQRLATIDLVGCVRARVLCTVSACASVRVCVCVCVRVCVCVFV